MGNLDQDSGQQPFHYSVGAYPSRRGRAQQTTQPQVVNLIDADARNLIVTTCIQAPHDAEESGECTRECLTTRRRRASDKGE